MNEEGCTFVSPKIWDNTLNFSTACQTPVFALFDDILLFEHIDSGIKGWVQTYDTGIIIIIYLFLGGWVVVGIGMCGD